MSDPAVTPPPVTPPTPANGAPADPPARAPATPPAGETGDLFSQVEHKWPDELAKQFPDQAKKYRTPEKALEAFTNAQKELTRLQMSTPKTPDAYKAPEGYKVDEALAKTMRETWKLNAEQGEEVLKFIAAYDKAMSPAATQRELAALRELYGAETDEVISAAKEFAAKLPANLAKIAGQNHVGIALLDHFRRESAKGQQTLDPQAGAPQRVTKEEIKKFQASPEYLRPGGMEKANEMWKRHNAQGAAA